MDYDKGVLLGRKVAVACGYSAKWPFLRVGQLGGRPTLLFPHPSGRNRLFNDPRFKARAIRVLRRFVR
jgi:hypothetical protein